MSLYRFLFWFVGDLQIFRQAIREKSMGEVKRNLDNSSTFKAFPWAQMPAEFFVKISDPQLLAADTCDKCLCPTTIYGNDDNKRLCPKCMKLCDYTGMLDYYKKNHPGRKP